MSRYVLFVVVVSCLVGSCTKDNGPPPEKTAAELVSDGWSAYAAKNYSAALSNFTAAIAKDGSLADAYNGAGWTSARNNNLAGALTQFQAGATRDTSNIEIKAGMAFVYHAQKDYALSVAKGTELLVANAGWVFSHDPLVSAADIHLLLAEDYFALASYSLSLLQVQILNASFTADVSTVAGQEALAKEIERLRPLV